MPNVPRRKLSKKPVIHSISSRSIIRAKKHLKVVQRKKIGNNKLKAPRLFSKIFIFLLVGIIGIGALLLITFFFLSRQSRWNGKDQFTFLIIDQSNQNLLQRPLSIVTINGSSKEVSVLALPSSLQMKALRTYGEFPADSLFSLYEQEKLPTSYVEGTLTYNLGIVIDGRIETTRQSRDKNPILDIEPAVFQSLFHFKSGLMPWGDRWKVWLTLFANSSAIADIDLSDQLFLPAENGKVVFDQTMMDRVLEKYFLRENFMKDRWDVAVINTTNSDGVATFWGKRLKQAGFQLISIDSFTPEEENLDSTVYLSPEAFKDQQVIQTLLSVFPIQLDFQESLAMTQKYRSDVVVFISENLVKEYP